MVLKKNQIIPAATHRGVSEPVLFENLQPGLNGQ